MLITASGTKLYIGPAIVLATTDSAAEFAALTPYVEIKEIENYGELGDEAAAVLFAAVGDARVRKSKGARDAGVMALVCGREVHDPGQIALEAAEQTNQTFSFKMELPDAPTEDYSNSFIYFGALVMSKRLNVGGNDNIIRDNFNLGINTKLYVIPSAELP